jgi:hypothetical protein
LQDEAAAIEEFRKGAKELFKEGMQRFEKIRQYGMKCTEELQKRELWV